MEKKERSQAFLRKRKMLLAMPLLVIPFLTLGFWALGGGKGDSGRKADINSGLNPTLPDARLKEEKIRGKLSFYDQAAKDSVKLAEWIRNDPYYRSQLKSEDPVGWEGSAPDHISGSDQLLNPSPYQGSGTAPEEQIMKKLAALQKGLNEPATRGRTTVEPPTTSGQDNSDLSGEVDRLEHLMEEMKSGPAEDPGMEKLESVMNKILDIQHPERVRKRMEEAPASGKEVPHTLHTAPTGPTVSLLEPPQQSKETRNGFYSGEEKGAQESGPAATQAVVHGTQTLTEGSVVKLRLLQDIHIGEAQIPKGSFVYGKASFSKERLNISITSLRHTGALYPVALEVYDLDGMAGLSIPGALEREVAKESADRSLAALQLSSVDPSLEAKAASTGLSAIKNLLSRKAKQVKVTVKGGYRVLLQDKKSKR